MVGVVKITNINSETSNNGNQLLLVSLENWWGNQCSGVQWDQEQDQRNFPDLCGLGAVSLPCGCRWGVKEATVLSVLYAVTRNVWEDLIRSHPRKGKPTAGKTGTWQKMDLDGEMESCPWAYSGHSLECVSQLWLIPPDTDAIVVLFGNSLFTLILWLLLL